MFWSTGSILLVYFAVNLPYCRVGRYEGLWKGVIRKRIENGDGY